MRSPQKSNRARGRGGRKPNGNILNRVFESAGPDGKVRGTAQQIVEKYLALARDAQTAGDRVKAENFLQHAEHYQRIILDATSQRDQRREQSAPETPAAPPAQANAAHEASAEGRAERAAPAEVGGLTTIDTVDDEPESLLVETEETAPARPRRRRGRGTAAAAPTASEETDVPVK